MNEILNAWPPITNSIGFVSSPFENVVTYCDRWLTHQGYAMGERITAKIEDAIAPLKQLTKWQILVVQCQNGWTSIWKDADNECEGTVSLLAEDLDCLGVVATCIPGDAEDQWNALQLMKFNGELAERTISVINDQGSWSFEATGKPLACETTDLYQHRDIRKRFTLSDLHRCLGSLGIAAHDADFYTQKCVLYKPPKPTYTGKDLRVNGIVINK